MATSATVYHVTATESRTLCGSSAVSRVGKHVPWDDWIELYGQDREQCCAMCRHHCLHYADRARMIRGTDRIYYNADPERYPHP